MLKSLSTFFACLILVVGIPLSSVSFVEAYNLQPEKERSIETVASAYSFNPVDYPCQEGDIRIIKDFSQKLRSNHDDTVQFIASFASLLQLTPEKQAHQICSGATNPAILDSGPSIYLRIRTLLI